jgi:hypothetical protein
MSVTNAVRLFQPLGGDELRKILVDEFEQMLEGAGVFLPHLSFSLADYVINLKITSNPPLFNDIDLERGRKLVVDDVESLPTKSQTVNMRASRERVGEVPDAEREEHGLTTTEVRRDPVTGTHNDVPVESGERVKTQATVGKGTRPRGATPERVEKAARGSAELSDDGEPILVNKG